MKCQRGAVELPPERGGFIGWPVECRVGPKSLDAEANLESVLGLRHSGCQS